MKTAIFSLLALVCVILVTEVSAGLVKKDTTIQSIVAFSIYNAGMEVMGNIQGISADIAFKPDDLEHSYIHATADPATLQTGIGIRDKHLQRIDYFDVKNHPHLRIVSKGFRKTGKNTFTGRFDLTMKGITKEIAIPFKVLEKQYATIYKGNFEINRLDFNLGEKSAILDEKVKIFIEVHTSQDLNTSKKSYRH
ncbi:YceI family protein [Rhodocytophaga rosea]|uniref:YceI family protein n=1 Tax=Rhodocytophaga rosea TaxID=2704465 RepID=A0A6C0GMB1_9BACT|nr:YceI family protein [Rhodocytophaga rosea]QHT68770.1 YceI family protein [Rhodocytophaga rosea]